MMWVLVTVLALAALALWTTGSEDVGAQEFQDLQRLADTGRVVEVVMREFAFEPESIHVGAGEIVTFNVTNQGAVDHEFRLSNQRRIDAHITAAVHSHGDGSEGAYFENGDFIIVLGPGATGQMVVQFDQEETVLTTVVCLLPGHYEAGMFGPIGHQE